MILGDIVVVSYVHDPRLNRYNICICVYIFLFVHDYTRIFILK